MYMPGHNCVPYLVCFVITATLTLVSAEFWFYSSLLLVSVYDEFGCTMFAFVEEYIEVNDLIVNIFI